jgi:hexosaminidase
VPWRDIQPSKEDEPKTYGGYYTQEQVKDIVKYAKERNITIVPEIEMPGHSAAALAAYPNLSCRQQPQLVPVARAYPESENNYCAGNDSVFIFLENVLTEVMKLFPSEYIHVGGDEVKKTAWENCPRCQSRIRKLGLKDENELQSYFIRRIENFLIAHHRKLIGWDEILEGGLAPGATVMSWRGEAGGIEAAKMHHDVVMSPGKPLYFDKYQSGATGEPVAIGGLNTAKMVYEYDPVPQELSEEEAKYILGAQANVWTEFISTNAHLEYMILPRMLALAEATWTPLDAKNWNKFYDKLQYHFIGFDQKGLNFSNVNSIAIKSSTKNGKILVSLISDIPDAEIYLTTDGSMPSPQSQKYEEPLLIESPIIIKAIAVIDGKVVHGEVAEKRFSIK